MPFCPNCGQGVPAEARFCPACAQRLSPPEVEEPSEERKLATVLFADLVGSTRSPTRRIPSARGRCSTASTTRWRRRSSGAGGTVEKFVGDAVMAAFGAPAGAGGPCRAGAPRGALDAAAARGALRRRARATDRRQHRRGRRRPAAGGKLLRHRRRGQRRGAARAGGRAGRDPRRRANGRRRRAAPSSSREPTTVEAKGKPAASLPSARARSLADAAARSRRAAAGFRRSRAASSTLLRATYARRRATDEPQLVTIIGDAGVGKTHARARVLGAGSPTQSPEPLRRTGRCLSYGQGITYWPLAEVLREHSASSRATRRTSCASPGRARVLGLTLGLEAPRGSASARRARAAPRAWVEFLEELVAERPTVVLIEDLHWAEEPLLDLLDAASSTMCGPLLLLATARPELSTSARLGCAPDAQPAARGAARRPTPAMLDELARRRAARVDPRRSSSSAPRATRSSSRSSSTLIDKGVLERANGGWSVRRASAGLRVPDSVQAVLAARIDLLPPAEKAALQAAAVIGRDFWTGPVYELVGERCEPDLGLLEERDFVRAVRLVDRRRTRVRDQARADARGRLREPAEGEARAPPRSSPPGSSAPARGDATSTPRSSRTTTPRRPARGRRPRVGGRRRTSWPRSRACRRLAPPCGGARGRTLRDRRRDRPARAGRGARARARAQAELWQEIGHANALYFNGARSPQRCKGDRARHRRPRPGRALRRAGAPDASPPDVDVAPDAHRGSWIERALELRAGRTAARRPSSRAAMPNTRSRRRWRRRRASWPSAREIRPCARMRRRAAACGVRSPRLRGVAPLAPPPPRTRRRAGRSGSPCRRLQNAIAPAVALGRFDEARRYAIAHAEVTGRSAPPPPARGSRTARARRAAR